MVVGVMKKPINVCSVFYSAKSLPSDGFLGRLKGGATVQRASVRCQGCEWPILSFKMSQSWEWLLLTYGHRRLALLCCAGRAGERRPDTAVSTGAIQ